MSFGFLGIQFGWGLQLANMSAIYTKLGADPDKIPILWIAGPVTGLIVQPIIGSMSDRTWNRLGRRRPYFLIGAILSSIALFFMPDSSALWMAAGLLWILDASINISMEPFRAFVADKLNVSQRTTGFITQSFFIGIGATLANALPYIFRRAGMMGQTTSGIPFTVQYSFKIGAFAFLLCVLWTVFTSREYPPENMEEFERMRREKRGIGYGLSEIFSAIREMPQTMKQLAVVQVFTWLGLFCMWMFFGLTTAYYVFGAPNSQSPIFDAGIEWGGICFATYSIVTFIVSFLLVGLAGKFGRKTVHAVSLVCGGVGLLSVFFLQGRFLKLPIVLLSNNGDITATLAIDNKILLLLTMVGVGIAWASILAMPYAILSGALPAARMGVYMGIFNFFIVIPEIIASLTFQPLVKYVFGNNPLYVVMLGGACLLVAALLVTIVRDVADKPVPERAVIEADEFEPLTVQESVQPVPSTGLIDEK